MLHCTVLGAAKNGGTSNTVIHHISSILDGNHVLGVHGQCLGRQHGLSFDAGLVEAWSLLERPTYIELFSSRVRINPVGSEACLGICPGLWIWRRCAWPPAFTFIPRPRQATSVDGNLL